MKLLAILAILALSSKAQTLRQNPDNFGVSKVTSLSGAAEVITVQGTQAAHVGLTRTVAFKSFDASCSVACTITLERDGTAATATSLAIVQLNGETRGSTAVAFSSSNAGAGTVLAQYSLTAGGQIAVDLTGKQLYSGTENLTIRTSSITGTTTINLQWTEQ